jgi:tyrosine-protein kinase Etk/Wzc
MSQEPNFIRYAGILIRWKRFIIINFIAVLLLATAISFILPRWYKSTASLLPPKQPDLFGSLGSSSSMLKGISGLGKLGGFGQRSDVYNYFAILKSRTTMESVIRKFNLISVYDVSDSSMEKAIKKLEGNTEFEEQPDDNITIMVYDKDPVRAADMANYFVEVLNEVSTRLGTQEARSNREFIEGRVSKIYKDLHQAEDSLRAYEEKSPVIVFPDENSSGLSAVAELFAMKAKKEIELGILERTVSPDNSELMRYKIELSEINKKVARIPETGIGTLRLYRQVVIQQKILEFVLPLLEQAKVEEKKDVPSTLVLDKAVPAERKSKPQRVLIVFLSTFLALTFSILLVFLMQTFQGIEKDSSPVARKFQAWVNKIAVLYHIKGQ